MCWAPGGGAFLAGVRYGKATLYMRSGGTQEIFARPLARRGCRRGGLKTLS
jgi:hypothetical protein